MEKNMHDSGKTYHLTVLFFFFWSHVFFQYLFLFQGLFSHTALPCEWEYLASSAAMVLLELRKQCCIWVRMLYSSGFFCLHQKWVFASTTFLSPTTMLTIDGKSQNAFMMSTHFRFGPRFYAVRSQVSHLSSMAFTSSQPWFQAIKNVKPARAPKTHGTMWMVASLREKQG